MKKILCFMFVLNFLISCQLNTSKKTVTAKNTEDKSKANVTINAVLKRGICINCD